MLVIIIILLCILIGLYVFDRFFKEDNIAITENSLNSINIDTEQSDNNSNGNNVIESKIETKEVIVEKGVFVPFDASKVTNLQENQTINRVSKSDKANTTSVYFKDDGTVTISLIDKSSLYNANEIIAETGKDYSVTGFSGNVVDVFVANYGQAVSLPMVLFLIEDGTVEYLNTNNAFKDLKFTSSGKISGLSDIVGFENVGLGVIGQGGGETIVAIRNNGTSTIIDTYELNK